MTSFSTLRILYSHTGSRDDFQSVIKRQSICNLMEVFWIRIEVLFPWSIYPFFMRIFRREFVTIKIPPTIRYSQNIFAKEKILLLLFVITRSVYRLNIILIFLIDPSVLYIFSINIKLYKEQL